MWRVDDVDIFFKSLESSGGYAILAGAVLGGVFWLARQVIQSTAQRAKEREGLTRQDFAAQLERERANRAAIEGMTDRVITALDGNTKVIATVIETTRETNDRLEALDRHLARSGSNYVRQIQRRSEEP